MEVTHNEENNFFLILPSQRLLKYDSSHKKLVFFLNTKVEDYAYADNKLAVVCGKTVKCYDIREGFRSNSVPILESYFAKKVQGITIDSEGKIVITDKFGDIYEVHSENSLLLNSNLGIPMFMKHIRNEQTKKQFIVLGDDYCKIKVYNYKNMHQITAIWYIPNSVPLDLLLINDKISVLLVKHQDKENLKHTYKIYQFNPQDLEESDFKGCLLFQGETELFSSNDFHPCSIIYCNKTQSLFYLKLHSERIELTIFKYIEGSTELIKLGQKLRVKLPTPIKEANSIEGLSFRDGSENFLLISYGKYLSADTVQNQSGERVIGWEAFKKSESEQQCEVCKISEDQYLLKLKYD